MDSLKKRYLYKLLANFIGVPIAIGSQLIVPRALGPKEFGDFVFLTNFFQQVIGFLDMGTSAYFYTKLSQNPKDIGLVMFYYAFFGVATVTIIVAFWGIKGFSDLLWPEQEIIFVLYGLLWGIIYWFSQIVNKMVDAFGITVATEKSKITQKMIGLILMCFLLEFGLFSLENYFILQYMMFCCLIGFLFFIANRNGHIIWDIESVKKYEVTLNGKAMIKYSYPLFIYSLISLLTGLFDRWLLQIYGGSVEQGYFGLSYQVGTICFLFTSAMTPLLTREFSIAYSQKNILLMSHLFKRYIPLLYSIAAYFSFFVFSYSLPISSIIGGESYCKASMTIMIMALYPIHQTYGQLSGSLFYATGQTNLYRNIGVFFMIIGILISYFLLSSKESFGLGMGATGLSIKMLTIQFLIVNTQLFFNSKFLNIRLLDLLFHQLICSSYFLCLGLLTYRIFEKSFSSNIAFVTVGGIFYTLLSILGIYFFPSVIGINREDIKKVKYILTKRR